jgi:hypothetical protein
MKKRTSDNIKFKKIILESLLKGVPSASAWVFSKLIEFGEITAGAFFSPSIYKDYQASSILYFDSTEPKDKPKEKIIKQSIRRLQREGFVEKRDGKFFLSKKGKRIWDYAISRKKALKQKWDGKYRLVIFDIPEDQALDRNWLRQELYILEYKLLQKSVFVGKAPLPGELIKSIKTKKLGNYVNYILAEKIYQNIKG